MRTSSLLAGLALALYTVPHFAVAAGPPALPLTVDASVVRSGEVGVAGGGLLLTGSHLRPGRGESASGRLELISETSTPVDVTVQDIGLPSGLEDQIWLRVTLNDVVVFQGPEAGLRQSSSRSFRMLPGSEVPIEIRVAIPGHRTESAGRHAEIRVRVVSPAAGAR